MTYQLHNIVNATRCNICKLRPSMGKIVSGRMLNLRGCKDFLNFWRKNIVQSSEGANRTT